MHSGMVDVNFFKIIGEEHIPITETREYIRLVMDVPDNLMAAGDAGEKSYSVIRVHDGETVILEDLDDDKDTITVEMDRFSIYAIIYKAANNSGATADRGRNGMQRRLWLQALPIFWRILRTVNAA